MKYRFGQCEIDVERHQLLAGGVPQAVEPQVFDLLLHFVRNKDRLISRDELIEAVWGGRIVSDAAVSARINAARRAIGDDGTRQLLIKTVPRRGFRFVADLHVSDGAGDPHYEDGQSTHAGIGARSPADKPSIAVLPFSDLSEADDREHFAKGLTDDITTALSMLSDMFVIDSGSALAVQRHADNLEGIAEALNVRHLLRGTIRRGGKRLRITAQLIDAESGGHAWADRYDRDVTDIFDLQDEITDNIVTALQVELTEGDQARLRRRQTSNIVAWEDMVRGQDHLRRFTLEENVLARELFEQAIGQDPDFGAAWSLLAMTYLVDARLGWGSPPDVSLEKGSALAERALSIDPELPDALAIAGGIRLFQRRYDEAEAACRRAVEVGPSVADNHVWLASALNYTGRAEEALRLIEKATRLSPYYPAWYLGISGVSYRVLGRFEEAIEADEKRLERSPDNPVSDFRLAAVYAERGQIERAREHIAALLVKNPKASIRQVRVSEPYRDEAEMERYLGYLRQAGMPE
ncbi:MAG: winged helix-turn-helix domain-containing protein [Alphaproteobacteria bacterium]|nr:winged helix-turn-helix domain-containing protein [Alphaproteobacteria bacterium]